MRVERVRLARRSCRTRSRCRRLPRRRARARRCPRHAARRRISLRDRRAGRCPPAAGPGFNWNGCQLTSGRNARLVRRELRERRAEPPPPDEAPRTDDVRDHVDRQCGRSAAGIGARRAGNRAIMPVAASPRAIMRRAASQIAVMPAAARWDIFCRVVDNYGDAGVCWRLARQLAAEHALDVTLWLDDLAPLARIAPGVDRELATPASMGVDAFAAGTSRSPTPRSADATIEAFGCGLPDALRRRDGASDPVAPTWFVLEYLSAEAWVDALARARVAAPAPAAHAPFLVSRVHARTGGLLRERGLLDARDAIRRRRRRARGASGRALDVPPIADGEIRASLFCYANPGCPRSSTRGPTATRRSRASCPTAWPRRARRVDRRQRPARRRPAHARRADAPCDSVRRRRTTTTGCCGRATSISSAARIRSSARNGRRALSSGTSIRRPRVRIWREARRVPRSATRPPRQRAGGAACAGSGDAWNGAPDAAPIGAAWQRISAARAALARHAGAWSAHLAATARSRVGAGRRPLR